MTDRSPDKEDAVDRLLAGLDDVAADPAFRARLRQSFVASSPARAQPALWQRPWVRAAAALVVAALILRTLLGPDRATVEVLSATGPGPVTVDGAPVSTTDLAALQAALEGGGLVTLPADTSLVLLWQEAVAVELDPATRVELPALADAGDVPWRMEAGELRVRTGPALGGGTFQVRTPEAQVVVTGSLLSIQCDDSGTCVCILEGEVAVGRNDADMDTVPPGQRKVLPRAGGSQIVPVAPPHESGVRDFDARLGSLWPER